jgi:hypothetical protein
MYIRERASGTYYTSVYFTAKAFADTSVQASIPIIFVSFLSEKKYLFDFFFFQSCIVYFLVGFQLNAGKFFVFTLFMILCSFASRSLALMISALCKTTQTSVTVLPMLLEVTRLFGGFLLTPSRLPKYFSWLDALSYIKYVYIGISLNEWGDLKLTCTANDTNSGNCIPNGEIIIQSLGFDYISIGGCIGVFFSFIILYRIIAFLGIRFLKH